MVQVAADVLLGHTQLHEVNSSGLPLAAPHMVGPRATGAPATDRFVTYSARKPYVVAELLEELRGPTAGMVTLPPHLDWSGHATYDLGRPARLASMYRSVLNEAACTQDLRAWLNDRLLVQLWPSLWLPAALRRAWEGRFSQLGALRASAA